MITRRFDFMIPIIFQRLNSVLGNFREQHLVAYIADTPTFS